MPRPSLFIRKKASPQPHVEGAASGSQPPQEKAAAPKIAPVTIEIPTEQPSKRQKSKKGDAPSLNRVARHFADMGDTHVTEEELSRWRGKSQEDKDSFILKGTSELLIHLHDREERRIEDAISMKRTEEALSKLKEDFKSQKAELKRALDAWKGCQKLLTEEKAHLQPLKKQVAGLKKANEDLAAANSQLKSNQTIVGGAEREKIELAAFDEGVNSYVATFLAGAPEFNWQPQFGSGMAQFIKDFWGEQQELIAFKKKELEGILAQEASTSQMAEEQARPEGADEQPRPEDNLAKDQDP